MASSRTYRVLDRDYPHVLRDLPSPPDPLCVRGDLLPAPAVAIVGTREPSREAEAHTRALARRLAASGVQIWSGGALGIDAAAHRGALDVGGTTVAVVGTGLDHCYPSEHEALYEEIVAAGGAIVSPFRPSQFATLYTFPQRNGVLAALTQATVVVQAPIKSGARSTASFARRLRRPLFVVPAAPWDAKGAGNLAEIDLGARPLADEKPLFRLLGVPQPVPAPPVKSSANSDPTVLLAAGLRRPTANESSRFASLPPWQPASAAHRTVFLATENAPRHLDDLCEKTGLKAALVQEALLTLTLEAVLVEGPAGWFRRSNIRKY